MECHHPECKSVFLLVLELVIAIPCGHNDLESNTDFEKHTQACNCILDNWILLKVILSNSTCTIQFRSSQCLKRERLL